MNMGRSALFLSALFHISLIALIYFGLPSIMDKRVFEENVVTVELLPISEITNVKPQKKPAPTKKEKKTKLTALKPKPSLPDPNKEYAPKIKPEPLPKPKEPAPVKKDQAKKPVPVEKKQPTKKTAEKPQKDMFASVLKTVEKIEEHNSDNKEQDDKLKEIEDFLSKSKQTNYKPGIPLSLSEKDAIRQQIMSNWTVLAGAKNAEDVVVTLNIALASSGEVVDVKIKNMLRYNSDSFYKAIVDSAVRAVYKSSPLKNLPPEKYDTKDGWRELELNFDPSDMFF